MSILAVAIFWTPRLLQVSRFSPFPVRQTSVRGDLILGHQLESIYPVLAFKKLKV
jgi:hypothetical protein